MRQLPRLEMSERVWRSPNQVLTHAAPFQAPLVAARGAREGLWLEQCLAHESIGCSSTITTQNPDSNMINYSRGIERQNENTLSDIINNYHGHYLPAGGLSVNNYVRENKVREVIVRD